MSLPDVTDDVALVRVAYERFNARDADGMAELLAADGELFPYAIDEHRHDGYRGHDGLRDYIADVDRLFETFSVEIEDYRDTGDGVVIAEGRIRGTTRDGIPVDTAASWLWTCRDGKVARMQAHPAASRPTG
jgi:ketosteroid isomerase-like protein